MLKIHADDWFAFKGESVFDLQPSTYVDLTVSCTKPIRVELVDTDGQVVPIWHGGSGRFRAQVKGFTKMILNAPVEAGACLKIDDRQIEEPHSKDPTVPEYLEAANLLQRIRQEVRRQMGAAREAFAERDVDLPGYEIDEDDDLFEEDMLAAAATAREQAGNDAETSDNIYADKSDSNTSSEQSEDK